ncbi:MAG: IS200/IS605 family transposase [Ignavibacteriales bacterium]|nr:IS200/IS605 family transposase [Ignavibacteriales bacterium]
MPYVRIWVHLVWSTKNRKPMLQSEIRSKVFDHIKVNAKAKDIFLDTIGGYIDHLHALISLGSSQTIAKVAQLLKGESSHWVNQNFVLPGSFEWQDEYFAVSVCESDVERVREYIRRQEEHHRKKSFAEEYQEFLRDYCFVDEGLKSV